MTADKKNPRSGNNALTISLALLAGLGLTMIFTAAALGVIEGTQADDRVMRLLFAAGAALLISGVAAWAGAVRPWEHFDDINIPADSGHHENEH